jgi:transcriptional regulator with XRE-family HTH domain
LRAGRRCAKNTGARFRDVAGRFFPARREMCAAIWACAEESDSRDVEKCADERIGLRKLLVQRLTGEIERVKSFGELIARRRKELGLTQTDLAGRIKGRSGEPVSQQRITDIEHDRFGVPRRPILEQLARALKLDIDVLYLWGRVIPSDIRAEGLSEENIKEAWRAFRAVIERERKNSRRRI